MGEFLDMAKKGRIYLVGNGRNRMNPIHGADLAVACVDAVEGGSNEIDVGGPEVLSYREIAELAFGSLGKPVRITVIPAWIMGSLVAITKIFNRHQGELMAFFTNAMTTDGVAPAIGSRRLGGYFADLSREATP